MGQIPMYSFTEKELEELADVLKVLVVLQLSRDKLIDPEMADEWCKMHTIITVNKSIWRTISDLWRKEPNGIGTRFRVVKGE